MFSANKCVIKMSNTVKDIDTKNGKYYIFNDIINYKNFDPNNIKIGENSYKNYIKQNLKSEKSYKILIYYIGYVTIKDFKYVKIDSVNPLYFTFDNVNGYFLKLIKIKFDASSY